MIESIWESDTVVPTHFTNQFMRVSNPYGQQLGINRLPTEFQYSVNKGATGAPIDQQQSVDTESIECHGQQRIKRVRIKQ